VKSEQDIVAALRALAAADEGMEPAPELETRVRRAFRARQARRGWNRVAAWTLTAAAAAAVAIAIFVARQPHPQPASVASQVAPAVVKERVVPVQAAAPVAARRARPRRPREIATEFFPLIDAPPPMERGALFRVTVSAAAMRTVGLPVAEDRLADPVQADVLVSEEGLATAIRFVKYE
jgi:hypothetical protein